MFRRTMKEALRNQKMLGFACFVGAFTLLSTSALAGTCVGGLDNGRSCTYSSQCRGWCLSGPYYHQYCTGSSQCGATCANNGLPCYGNSHCPGSYCKQHACQFAYCLVSSVSSFETPAPTCVGDALFFPMEELASQ